MQDWYDNDDFSVSLVLGFDNDTSEEVKNHC